MIKVLISILTIIFFLLILFLSRKLGKQTVAINYFFILIILMILLFIFFIDNDNTMNKYISPSYDGEKVMPGYFYEENS